MSVRPDTHKTTAAPSTVPNIRRAPRPIHPPRWLLPGAIAVLVVAAVVLGVSQLRSGDDGTTTPYEPLIVPEEQAYIDAHTAQLPRAQVALRPDVVISARPSGVPGLIGPHELDYIEARVPLALHPSPTSAGYPQLIGPEELAYISDTTVSRAAQQQRVDVPMRPTGVPGLIGPYELDYIEARVPQALTPSPASMGFPQLIGPEELAYINGEYDHPDAPVEDWCHTHVPC